MAEESILSGADTMREIAALRRSTVMIGWVATLKITDQ